MLFLASLPLWQSGLLLVVLTTGAAMCGPVLLRRSLGLSRLVSNNEVAGFKFAVVGVIYAVLLGFAVIVLWEKVRDAEAATMQESAGVVAVFRLAGGLDPAAEAPIRQKLTAYVETAIVGEWPRMAEGRGDPQTSRALSTLYRAVLAAEPRTPREQMVLGEVLARLDAIAEGRRVRLRLAAGIVPPVLWVVLFMGAVITVGFTLFFGTDSVRAQVLMAGMLALMIFIVLWVAVVINYPFAGPVSVGPEALRMALEAFDESR